jgi:uncharacterized membrane protein
VLEDSTRKDTIRALLVLGIVFLLGMISGAALFHLGRQSAGDRPPRGPAPLHPLERMRGELDLSEDQEQAIRAILDEQRQRLEEVLEDSREAIRGVLSQEQAAEFDAMRPPRDGGRGKEPPGHEPPGMRRPPHPPGPPPPPGGHPPPGGPPPAPRRGDQEKP